MKTSLRSPLFILAFSAFLAVSTFSFAEESPAEFPFRVNDRVAWIGSSSTRIGTWCRTMEFLLRTRHPELKLTFSRGTTGGGTFATGIKYLPAWLQEAKPTYVLFNYGGNDAGSGPKGTAQFKSNMQKCYEIASSFGARVQFVTPQSGDVRVTAQVPYDNRKQYSEMMVSLADDMHWTIYDTHHPLETLQLEEQKEIPDYTINRDRIHLTDSAYVCWGYYLYAAMNPPEKQSLAEINADGTVAQTENCRIESLSSSPDRIEFVRTDAFLPLLPPDPIPSGNALRTPPPVVGGAVKQQSKIDNTAPTDSNFLKIVEPVKKSDDPAVKAAAVSVQEVKNAVISVAPALVGGVPTSAPTGAKAIAPPAFKIPAAQAIYATKNGQQLPPRQFAPLEKYSRYMLRVNGLKEGTYVVSCEGKPLGTASAEQLKQGVNLNSLLLDSKNTAPWNEFMKEVWAGRRLNEIGRTAWRFSVARKE